MPQDSGGYWEASRSHPALRATAAYGAGAPARADACGWSMVSPQSPDKGSPAAPAAASGNAGLKARMRTGTSALPSIKPPLLGARRRPWPWPPGCPGRRQRGRPSPPLQRQDGGRTGRRTGQMTCWKSRTNALAAYTARYRGLMDAPTTAILWPRNVREGPPPITL